VMEINLIILASFVNLNLNEDHANSQCSLLKQNLKLAFILIKMAMF
jgi:hypothetical protein